MTENIHGYPKSDTCAYLFRRQKKSDPITEAALEPDMNLAIKMCELGLRVQDLFDLDYFDHPEIKKKAYELKVWYATQYFHPDPDAASSDPEKCSDTSHKSDSGSLDQLS